MDFRFLSTGKVYSLSVGLCAVLAFSTWGPSPAMADTFVVNELGDDADPAHGDDICGTWDWTGSHCTLRAAIEEANAKPLEGPHEILLAPALSGTIPLTSDFPMLEVDLAVRGVAANRVAIDGAGVYLPFNPDAGVSLTLSDLTVQHGYHAVYTLEGHVIVERCRFLDNSGSSGGGISVVGSETRAPTLRVTDSVFTGNTTIGDGGAINVAYGETHLENVTIVGNSANGGGGGIRLLDTGFHGASLLINLTVTDNTSDADDNGYGEGGGLLGSFASGGVFIANSVIAHNRSLANFHNDCHISGTITSFGHNVIGDGSGCVGINDVTDAMGVTSAPIDPQLGTLALNLGFTEVRLPNGLSPLLNSGGDWACSNHDQQGIPRPQDGGIGGTVCDIGAAERSHCDNFSLDEDERGTNCGGSICAACTCANPTARILRIQPGAQGGVLYENFYDIPMYQVADGDILKVREDVFPDYVNFVTGGTTTLAVSLEGGYDCDKTAGSNDGYFSKIKGSLTIGDHFAVTVSNIVIM